MDVATVEHERCKSNVVRVEAFEDVYVESGLEFRCGRLQVVTPHALKTCFACRPQRNPLHELFRVLLGEGIERAYRVGHTGLVSATSASSGPQLCQRVGFKLVQVI